MSKSKQWVTSIAVGTVLMGASLAAGLVVNNGNNVLSAQAASKTFTQDVTMPATVNKKVKRVLFKNLTAPVPSPLIDSYIDAATPKLAGYKAKPRVHISLYDENGQYKWMLGDVLNYYKVQKKYTGKKITVHDAIQATKNGKDYRFASRKVKAPNWSIVKVAAPKMKGYKANVKTVQLGVIRWSNSLTENKGGFDTLTDLRYTKITGYKVAKLAASRSKSGNLKVNGRVAVSSKTKAKAHKATYAVISDYKGKTYVKLSKKNTFSKTIKNRKGAKHTSVTAAYRTKKSGSKTYTYHNVSNKKIATVKVAK